MRMGKSAESVRFLDDVDLTFSFDGRSTSSQKTTSIEISVQPVVFRASYRDIHLITTIVNKAIQLYTQTIQAQTNASSPTTGSSQRPGMKSSKAYSSGVQTSAIGRANVVTTKEQVGCTYEDSSIAFLFH